MKFLTLTPDIVALAVWISALNKIIPSVVGLLAMVYYGFVVYDRIRYGPELENRLFWKRRLEQDVIKKGREDETTNT